MKLRLCRTAGRYLAVLLGCGTMLFAFGVQAASFAVGVSPPHFELRGKPGSVVRDVLLLLNTADEFGDYQLRSADWSMDERGGVTIHGPELIENSCRPWVRIERRKLQLEPLGRRQYRFEVHIPEDAEVGECRFALLISQGTADQPISAEQRSANSIRMPIAAQIAVIVYVAVGDATPELSFVGASVETRSKGKVPILTLHNSGLVHGRPFGNLIGTDAAGKEHSLVITPTPVLAGANVDVVLQPDPTLPVEEVVPITFPLQLKGSVEFEQGALEIDTQIE
ncbi:MAG: hypothetical protein VW985_11590 [Gammaproteobacteria bacterium]